MAAAWQPITFGGVAAFAQANWRRVIIVQFVIAFAIGSIFGWFLFKNASPVVEAVLEKLPETASIRNAALLWPEDFSNVQVENHFFALQVDPLDQPGQRQSADWQFELTKHKVRLRSLLGYLEFNYPAGWSIDLGRSTLVPIWGAWENALIGASGFLVVILLMLSWLLLGLIYAPIVFLLAWFYGKVINPPSALKVAMTALLPGALAVTVAFIFYAVNQVNLVYMGYVWLAHMVIGWVYVFFTPFFLPSAKIEPSNPFRVKAMDSGESKKPSSG